MKIQSYSIASALIALVFSCLVYEDGSRHTSPTTSTVQGNSFQVTPSAPNAPDHKGFNARRARFPKRYIIPPHPAILDMGMVPLSQARVKWA